MKKLHYLLTILVLLYAMGCATGRKAYLKGDYAKSVTQAVNRLQQNPTHKQSRDILHFAYPNLVKYNQDKINTLKRSSDAMRWEKVMDLYGELNRTYDLIQRCPAAKKTVTPQQFTAEFEESKSYAAEVRFQQGVQYMNQKDRNSLKSAYAQFQRALELKPSHPDAPQKLQDARNALMTRVIIRPIPMHSAIFSLSNDFFESQMMEYFRNYSANEFVRFESGRNNTQDGDHYIIMTFDDFQVGQTFVESKEEERRKDKVVIGKNVINKDSIVNVYGTVTAKVKLFRKTISSGGLLDVKIYDANTDALIAQKKFPGTFVWEDRWGMFMGDERALNDDDRKYMNKPEVMPPPPQQLFIEFTKPIFNQVTSFVDGFYRGY